MRTVTFAPAEIQDFFRKNKVLTKEQVLDEFGCKTMTFWKVLHDCGYVSSYNFNAKYYTLHEIAQFDELGLWSYRNILFSRYGTLSDTAIQLVDQSPAGYTAKELSEFLKVNVGPELSRLHRLKRIHRQKIGATFVYLSSAAQRSKTQVEEREVKRKADLDLEGLPAPELVVAVLVELVHHPGTGPRALSRRLARRGVPLTEKQIENIFTRYDLAGKKGP